MTKGSARPDEVPASLRPARLSANEAAALARGSGLRRIGVRPSLGLYLKDLWQWRHFAVTLSRMRFRATHQGNQLGLLWSVLNPLLLILSYFLVFGVLLRTNMGPGTGPMDRIAFLAPGVILFASTASVIGGGSKAVINNSGLMRSLRFPRAMLPISTALTEFFATVPALAVLLVVLGLTGVTPSWSWLLFPVAVLLHFMTLVGIALIGARVIHASRDLGNFIPVAIRVLRYVSGVFFAIDHYAKSEPWNSILSFQPFALPLGTARQALLPGEAYAIQPMHWLVLLAWAVGLMVIGLVVFWQVEDRYGSR